jgi:outer membrane protein OmpA-like peptidoglycan-associated protein
VSRTEDSLMKVLLLSGLAALLCIPRVLTAQDAAERDPWDPAIVAASEAAVARLGAKRARDIRPTIVNVTGLSAGVAGVSTGVAGRGTGIVASVQEVQQAKKQLGAQETELELRVELPSDVLFDFDKADIRPNAAPTLAHVATLIRAYPAGRALMEGHTDAVSSDAYNQKLSERRAEAVKRWLVEKENIEASRLATRGLGESRPVADNRTDEGRQKNRRVEVVIQKGAQTG